MERIQIEGGQISVAVAEQLAALNATLAEKGYGTFASVHEILGMLEEELLELKLAVHSGTHEDIAGELTDIGTGAIFALACLRAGALDW